MSETMGTLDLITFVTVLSIVAIVKGQDALCNEKLVSTLPDDHLSASSYRSSGAVHSGPDRARINTTQSSLGNGTVLLGAWAPTSDSTSQYVQAMFDDLTMINEIFTQGENLGSDRVTSFKVEYTMDGKTWDTVNNDIGVEQIFMGNSDGDNIMENTIDCPIFAKGIRIIPMDWDKHIALRFDVSGCRLDDTVVVVTTPQTAIGQANATTAKFLPGIVTPFGHRKLTTTKTTVPTTTRSRVHPTSPYTFHPGVANPFGVPLVG